MKKILVAETLRTCIPADDEGFLARNDIVISSAQSAEEILETHRANKADLIIVDLETPELGGDRLCHLIRNEKDLRAVSIIVACDYSAEAEERCKTFGANAVIHKPVNSNDLLSKIMELLEIRERRVLREIVKISVTVNSAGSFFFAVAKNVSASGLLFETGRVIPKGSLVSCSFVLQRQVVAEGEVVRVTRRSVGSGDNFEYGVRFIGLSPAAESEIEDYFNNLR